MRQLVLQLIPAASGPEPRGRRAAAPRGLFASGHRGLYFTGGINAAYTRCCEREHSLAAVEPRTIIDSGTPVAAIMAPIYFPISIKIYGFHTLWICHPRGVDLLTIA